MLAVDAARAGITLRRCSHCDGLFDPSLAYDGPPLPGRSTRVYCSSACRRLGHNWLTRARRRAGQGRHRPRVEQMSILDEATP